MFEPLNSSHDRASFDCGNEPMNRYLKTMASQHAKKGISATHILADGATIKAFYTLSNTQIVNDGLIKGYPNDIPAILLGRIGIDKPYQGKGLLQEILFDAFVKVKQFRAVSGMAFIVIDAKTDQLFNYYQQKAGFLPLVGNRLVYPINQI